MSDFAVLWKGVISRSKKSLYQIANETGIERSYLSKVGLGKRLPPDEDWIKRVLEVVGCSAAKSTQIFRAWDRAMVESKLGNDAGECMDAISFFLARASGVKEENQGDSPLQAQLSVFWEKAGREKRIDIWGGESSIWLADQLEALLDSRDIVCRHILMLSSAGPDVSERENLKTLGRYIPCVGKSPAYSPRVYYEDQKNAGMIGEMLGCILYLSGQVLFVDREFQSAVVFDEREQVEILKRKFELAYLDSYPVFTEYQSSQSEKEQRLMVEKNGSELYLLNHAQQLLQWQQWKAKMVMTVGERKELADRWRIFESKESYIHILSVAQLSMLMKELEKKNESSRAGRPMSAALFIEGLMKNQLLKDSNLQIFREEDYPWLAGIRLVSSSERFNYLLLQASEGKTRTLFFKETGLSYWIYWYLRSLGKGYQLPGQSDQIKLLETLKGQSEYKW